MTGPKRPRGDLSQLLVGAVVTLITAAILAVFSKVSDLGQADAAAQVRTAFQEKDVADLKVRVDRLEVDVAGSRIEMARVRASCEDWMRKIRQRLDGDRPGGGD